MERKPSRRECPRCGSTETEFLRIVEHGACGAIKPERAFRSDGASVCPDCGADCAGDLTYVQRGSPHRCRACGHQFDADRLPDASSRIDAVTDRQWGESLASLSTSGRGSHTLSTAGTLLLLLLVVGSSVVAAVGTAPLLEAEARSGDWRSYESIVIFRNDDPQPYYEPEAMRAVDRVFVEEGVPVTGAVIPAPGNMTLERGMRECEYWRSQRAEHPDLFEYSLHGYHHEVLTEFHGGSEFGGVPAGEQRRMIREGVRLFETCLGTTPETFVPPLETYDNTTAELLADQGFVGISSGVWFTDEYYNETGPFTAHGLVHVASSNGRFMKNWTTNEFKTERSIEREFDAAYRNGSLYVQMIHYQKFTTRERLDTLRGVIDHMKSKPGVKFMTLGEFTTKYANDRVRRTDDGWEVWEANEEPPSIATIVRRYVDSVERLVPAATARPVAGGWRA